MRSCGIGNNKCSLCCKLMPMVAKSFDPERFAETFQAMAAHGMTDEREITVTPEWDKPAGERCKQQCSKGCRIYDRRPFGCRVWQCQWLQGDTGDLPRPDRLHMVIDTLPDFVRCEGEDTSFNLPVIQVWCDPDYPDAHRDPAFRAWLLARSEKTGEAALIRFSERDGFLLAPPTITADKEWHERISPCDERENPHTPEEVLAATGRHVVVSA